MNSKHTLATARKPAGATRRRSPLWVAPAAFLATVLALPVNAAIVIPDDPLTTGTRVAPNILFILDDSGSMAWANMNNQDISEITGPNSFKSKPDANGVSDGTDVTPWTYDNAQMYMQNYATNSLYYNPSTVYQPWVGADGNRLSGGTSYTAAYSSDIYVTNSDAGTNGGSIDLSNTTNFFYVPKDLSDSSVAYLSNASNYYRYRIRAGSASIERGEYGVVTGTKVNLPYSPATGQVIGTNYNDHFSAAVTSGALVSFSIKATQNSTLYWLYDPNNNLVCSGQVNNGNTQTCSDVAQAAGTYRLRAKRWNNTTRSYSKYTLSGFYIKDGNGCDADMPGDYGWINCTPATPTGRSASAELGNFATWYSYYRTRTKAAKAGAAEAFRPLSARVRVGYRTIHDRSNLDIPVGSGDGRFVDDPSASPAVKNRSNWYNRLFAAKASSATPLQAALDSAGKYFKSTSSSGPYGPESGSSQLSCRQNFAILTTDGYWNSGTIGTGNADNSNGSQIKGPKGVSYKYVPSSPFQDSYKDTLADIAMKYWNTDLRTENYMGNSTNPDNNNVPTSDDDPAFWQHMVTFGISIGLKTTKKWTTVAQATAAINAGDSWPDPDTANPTNDNPRRIDDLLHAAVNGHGAFVSAASPSEFTSGLTQALAIIAQRTSSFSNVATNSTSLNTGAQVFAASYTSGIWTGKVQAFAVSHAGGVSSTPTWTATIPAYASRKVFTWNGTAGATFPTTAQTTSLDRSGVGPANFEVSGAENAKYIKGDTSKEDGKGGYLRSRLTVLGDIVNSSPAFVAKTNTIYVGANDGMLHAFDAGTGVEQFAYVPGIIDIPTLGTLSRGDYVHKFFVDGPVVVSPDSYVSGKNILVGTLGRGGKGLYALDVTAPGSFGTGSVLWERKDTPSGNIGNVIGAPIMGMIGTTPVVVFGNGPNSTKDQAKLIILNLNTGAVIAEIGTDTTTSNGLFAPTGVYGADGKTLVYVYAGDLQGNIWKFKLNDASLPANGTKIFHAEKTAGKPQPITSAPALAVDIATNKRWVFFGTGSYLTANDANDTSTSAQSMYGFMDDGASYTRANLTAREVEEADGYRYFPKKADLDSTGPKGWYVDLPGKGERIVQNAQINGTFMVTASMMPSGDSCKDAAGTGWINAIDAFTGTSGGTSMFDLDNDGSTDNSGAGGNPIGSVNTGVGMPTLPVLLPGQIVVGGTGDGASFGLGGAHTFGMTWQRVSWREIRND